VIPSRPIDARAVKAMLLEQGGNRKVA